MHLSLKFVLCVVLLSHILCTAMSAIGSLLSELVLDNTAKNDNGSLVVC